MSKKAQFFDMITGIQSMVLLVVILVIFGIIFVLLSADSTLHENKYMPHEDLKLLDYLKTPIIIDNQKTTLGDFIISANDDLEKRRILRSKINKVISSCNKNSLLTDRMILIMNNEKLEIGNFNIEGVTGDEPKPEQISAIALPNNIQITLFKSPIGSPHIFLAPPLTYNRAPIKKIDENNQGVSLIYLTSTAPNGEIIEDCEGKKWVHWSGETGTNFLSKRIYDSWSEEGYPCETEIINNELVCKNFPIKNIFNYPDKFKEEDVNLLIEKCFMDSKLPAGELIFNIDPKLKLVDNSLVGIHIPNREECIKSKSEFLTKYPQ